MEIDGVRFGFPKGKNHSSGSAFRFQGSFVLSIRRIPSELKFSNKGIRFFDCDHCPSKSLLHVLAQRSTRSSPALTSSQDFCSPSLMHVVAGDVEFTSHTHVPAASVQSYVQSDDLSHCTRHAAAVSSQVLPLRRIIASVRRLMILVLR